MPWINMSGAYIPAGGEKIRISFSYSYVPFTALTEAEIRTYIESAGYQVIKVEVGLLWPNTVSVELYAPGEQSMVAIGKTIADSVAESWRAWNVQIGEYQTWTFSLVPEPSTRQTVVIAAVALIVIAAVYFSHRYA